MTPRSLAVLLLLLSALPLFWVHADHLCFGDVDDVMYVSQMQSSNDDELAFTMIGLWTMVVGGLLTLIRHKFSDVCLVVGYLMGVLALFHLVANGSAIKMIMTSIITCDNHALAMWLVLLALSLGLFGRSLQR